MATQIHYVEIVTSSVDGTCKTHVAMHATEIPGQDRFAIYIEGGIEHGDWQV